MPAASCSRPQRPQTVKCVCLPPQLDSFSLHSLAKRLHGFDKKYCYLKKEKNFKQEVRQVISLLFPMWLIIECCGVITDKRLAGGYQVLWYRDYGLTTPSPNRSLPHFWEP